MLEMKPRFLSSSDEVQIGSRRWYDFIAPQVDTRMHTLIPETEGIALPDGQEVRLYLATELGTLELNFDRRRLSPTAPHHGNRLKRGFPDGDT